MIRVGLAITGLWMGWVVSWAAAAFWATKPEKSVGAGAETPYRLVLTAGTLVLFVPARGYYGPLRLWLLTRAEAWACVGLMALGFAFAWWARIHLGTLWSGQITTKADHRVVETGPYGIVRHPIYTGILLAILGDRRRQRHGAGDRGGCAGHHWPLDEGEPRGALAAYAARPRGLRRLSASRADARAIFADREIRSLGRSPGASHIFFVP